MYSYGWKASLCILALASFDCHKLATPTASHLVFLVDGIVYVVLCLWGRILVCSDESWFLSGDRPPWRMFCALHARSVACAAGEEEWTRLHGSEAVSRLRVIIHGCA